MPWVHLAKTVFGVVSLVWLCLALPLRAQCQLRATLRGVRPAGGPHKVSQGSPALLVLTKSTTSGCADAPRAAGSTASQPRRSSQRLRPSYTVSPAGQPLKRSRLAD